MHNINLNKRKITAILVLITFFLSAILFLSFVIAKVNGFTYGVGVEIKKNEDINDYFGDEQSIEFEKVIYDFGNNQFLLYELQPKGYAIFSVKNEAKIFLEGSDVEYSPYHHYLDKDLRYLGLGNYIYGENNRYIDIFTEEECDEYDLVSSYELQDEVYLEPKNNIKRAVKFPSNPDPDKTTKYMKYTCIKNFSYLENLDYTMKNQKGTCAIVALCILLGYLDEYVDGRFIPDNAQYNGHQFKNGVNPTQALHDYLFDNCLHTILGASSSNGYPMANAEIKKMMKDYLDNQCGVDFRKQVNFVDGSITYTHANPRKHINAGYPSIITMTKYTANYNFLPWEEAPKKDNKYHTVVAYGYNKENDTYRVNFGYAPDRSGGVIISEATIYSYNTFTL